MSLSVYFILCDCSRGTPELAYTSPIVADLLPMETVGSPPHLVDSVLAKLGSGNKFKPHGTHGRGSHPVQVRPNPVEKRGHMNREDGKKRE